MPLSISYTPGKVWTDDEVVTVEKLNQAANPTIDLAGSINDTSIGDGAVTTAKLADGALSADATGRAKMADSYLTAAKLGSDVAGDGLAGGDASALSVNVDGVTLELDSSTPKKVRIKTGGAAVIASSRNLVIQNNAAAPNNKVDIAADEVLLKSSGSPFLATSVSVTADLTASGANGLDTGSEASSTWYYIWLIYNGTTLSSLLSTSSTAPNLPSGYTYKALVGAARNNASGNFDTLYQQDRNVYVNDTNLFSGKSPATGDTYESYQIGTGSDVDLRTVIPPTAKRLRGTFGGSDNTTGHLMAVAADANGMGAVTVVAEHFDNNKMNGFALCAGFEIPLSTSQIFYWKGISGGKCRVNISGYSI